MCWYEQSFLAPLGVFVYSVNKAICKSDEQIDCNLGTRKNR